MHNSLVDNKFQLNTMTVVNKLNKINCATKGVVLLDSINSN